MSISIKQHNFMRVGSIVLALLIALVVWLNPASAFLHDRGETNMSTDLTN